ncbi:dihydroorotase [Pelagibacterales bacterium SAG-MED31]|nr:dihydroorotase [Pelagibacterales bacterium SAG-MED31]
MTNHIKIIQPDDWHVHFREGDMLSVVTKYSSRVNRRCIAMPNTLIPITTSAEALNYKKLIEMNAIKKNFEALIPCYLTDNLNISDFEYALQKNIFIGAKLYPNNATTNSHFGVNNIKNIYNIFEILEKNNKILLIHGELNRSDIDIFDREKYFIDEELNHIRSSFKDLKIVLEHVSSDYGVDFVKTNSNISGTITPHHMLLTKKDVFEKDKINPHHYCMPVVKNEKDLISLRKAACFDNTKFFLGTDSAPHHVNDKNQNNPLKAGIFSSPSSIELYASIFEEENALENLEIFSSINGPKFYNLEINRDYLILEKTNFNIPEYTQEENIKIKNFYGNQNINWKAL